MVAYSYAGSTALVTGGSAGIGEKFVEELATRCRRVVVVARPSERLDAVVSRLQRNGSADVEAIAVDLNQPNAVDALQAECAARGLHIDVLVNNAGMGTFGRFDAVDASLDRKMIGLNVTAATDVLHAFLPGMIARKRGVIINVASSAGLQPTPWFAVYGATKAYILSLTESMWALYRPFGIRITAVCPGPVDTGFFDKTQSNIGTVKLFQTRIKPEKVVKKALSAIDSNRR